MARIIERHLLTTRGVTPDDNQQECAAAYTDFERALQHEALAPLRAWVDAVLPPALRPSGGA